MADNNDSGVKLITVTVLRDGEEAAQLVGIQTRAWISSIPEYSQSTTTGQLPPANQSPAANIGNHEEWGYGTATISFSGVGSSDPEGDPLE